jgi:integrase
MNPTPKNQSTVEPGISVLPNGLYEARVTVRGQQAEATFATKTEARAWRTALKTDLMRCPKGIRYFRRNWIVELETTNESIRESFSDLNSAIEWHLTTRAEINSGNYVSRESKTLTLEGFLPTWRNSIITVSHKTRRDYESTIRNHVLPHLGEMRLRSITNETLRNWIATLMEQGVGATTIRNARARLQNIFQLAVIDQKMTFNPAYGLKTPKIIKKEVKALTWEETRQFAAACGSMRLFVLFSALVGTRIGETLALKVKDVDFTSGMISIRAGWTEDENGLPVLSTTKTDEFRAVKIPQNILEELLALTVSQPKNAFLFRSSSGGPLDDHNIRREYFAPARAITGLDFVTPHTLRHTCASMLIAGGDAPTTVAGILGHADATTTLRFYSHFYKELGIKAIDKLGELPI